MLRFIRPWRLSGRTLSRFRSAVLKPRTPGVASFTETNLCLARALFSIDSRKMTQVEAVLIDLSGTIHIEDIAIEGSQCALKRLRDSGIKIKFVTNTTKEPLRMLHERLIKLGFDIEKEEIFTSLTAARNVIQQKCVRPYLMLEESAKEDFEGIDTKDPNAVVVGLAPDHFNYEPMNKAFHLLLDGACLIAIHKARYYKKQTGLFLGPGPFVTGLEFASDTKAEVVGKPEKMFFHQAIQSLQVDPANTVMIGDDARDDVGGAIKAGMQGILVQTGKYREGDEDKMFSGEASKPPVCADFPSAVDLILDKMRGWAFIPGRHRGLPGEAPRHVSMAWIHV